MAGLKCPYCGLGIAWVLTQRVQIGADPEGQKIVESMNCPSCLNLIAQLVMFDTAAQEHSRRILWPRTSNRPPCPPEVPPAICEDYTESCLVFLDSPKASAALSRRCLQHILRDAAKVKPGELAKEIDQVLAASALPPSIAANLDAVRVIGNFAAHPIKSQHTGEVMAVLPGEAEWNLDVIEALMDVYYVQPEVLKAKKAALNAKLTEAGKQPIP